MGTLQQKNIVIQSNAKDKAINRPNQANGDALPFVWSWKLMDTVIKQTNVILSPWLPERGLAMIYGNRGYGKTRLAVAIAYTIATGDSLMGWKATKERRVLYIDAATSSQRLAEHLYALYKGSGYYHDMISVAFLTPDEMLAGQYNQMNKNDLLIDLSSPSDQKQLLSNIDEYDVIIIDNSSDDKNRNLIKQPSVQNWAMTMRALGKSVLFVDDSENYDMSIDPKTLHCLDTVIALKPSTNKPQEDTQLQFLGFDVHFEKTRYLWRQPPQPFRAELITLPDGRHGWVRTEITT